MFNKRRIFLLTILIISLSFCFQVKSYTMAKVNNSAIISVTSSDNALIAIPDNVSLDISKDITNTYVETMKDEIEKAVSNIETEINTEVVTKLVDNNFYITNNMNECIDIKIFIDERFECNKDTGIKVDFNRKNYMNNQNNIMVRPGEKLGIPFYVDNNIESKYLDVIISVKWNGGTAEIKKSLEVNVDTKVLNNEIRKDIRTPIKIEHVNSEIITENFNEGENKQLQNINNEEIQTENQELNVDTNLPKVEDENPDNTELPQEENASQEEKMKLYKKT